MLVGEFATEKQLDTLFLCICFVNKALRGLRERFCNALCIDGGKFVIQRLNVCHFANDEKFHFASQINRNQNSFAALVMQIAYIQSNI